MEVPALMTVLFGIAVIGACFILRIPAFILGFIALILLGITVYYHINQFSLEYRSMTLGDGIQSMAPTILVGAVIIMSVGYILMLSPVRPTLGRPAYGTAPSSKPGLFSSLFGSSGRGQYGYSQTTSTRPGFFSSFFGSKPSSSQTYRAPGYDSSDRRAYVSALDRLI